MKGCRRKGKPTRVFAYYGVPKGPAGTKFPAMVLIHGGGGTAFRSLGASLERARVRGDRHGSVRLRP